MTDTRVMTAERPEAEADADLIEGLRRYEFWTRFAFFEVRQRFRRSFLGPLWLTASMGIMVGVLGFVMSEISHQDVAAALPYIATGIIFWGLLTSCINDGATTFIANASTIQNIPLPISVHLYQMLARNLIVFGFNMVIYLIILVIFRPPLGLHTLLIVPGFALYILNLAWLALAAGILSTRFRDIPQVITSLIQVVFFVTPVFWSVETMGRRPAFVHYNPLYHLLELVRSPMLGLYAPLESWLWGLGLLVVGGYLTLLLFRRAHARLAYWV
ncbi:MAG TPA: ABC transporter permease [Devosia sp.]|nr:ABC transporter permease [Devosia sp.]